jgi:hypothetical protein
VLDENEFYEKQDIMKLEDFKLLSNFLNNFVYQALANELIGIIYLTCRFDFAFGLKFFFLEII